MALAPTGAFLLEIVLGVRMILEKAPNRCAVRLGLLNDHNVVAAHRDEQLIAGLQSERFSRLLGDHDLVFR